MKRPARKAAARKLARDVPRNLGNLISLGSVAATAKRGPRKRKQRR
jgi:hypothetical protein